MGSLCCVAARPHGSNAASRECSMSPQEPYWQTNTSFSPPQSRWNFRFQPEWLSFGSNEGSQLYVSSTSSNSSESRSWLTGNHLTNQQYDPSDGVDQYFSSPSDISPAQQWTPPIIQEISVDDYATSSRRVSRQLSFSPAMEGLSATQARVGSTSSQSDSSDYDYTAKTNYHRNFSSRRYFMSKPIHPLSVPSAIQEKLPTPQILQFQNLMLLLLLKERGPTIAEMVIPRIFLSLLNLISSANHLTYLMGLNVVCVRGFFLKDHLGVLDIL